jgi:tetratricopeptide (TPR) repeat protein
MNVRTALACFALLAACRSTPGPIELVPELAGYTRPVTTSSPEAQRYFDQGLTLYWGFDHEEAERCFARAAELDPGCAMAHWGQALCVGPNYNNPSMDEARSQAAYEALSRAQAHHRGSSQVEIALIEALSRRYAWPPPEDRRALDVAYADTLRKVAAAYPEDADVCALSAEALMDLRPWDLFAADGTPAPEAPEILAAIEAVLARHPLHPGANHLAVHAWEMSPTPEKALAAADRLRALVPGSGHLVHMPSHIDIRLGHYREAVEANRRAIATDAERVERWGAGGFYALYRAHNYHFLVYAAQFEGRYELALSTAREMVRSVPPDVVAEMPQVLDGFLATPLHVLERFGRWEEILDEPRPDERFPVTTAFWHFSRGLALSALGRVGEAEAERAAFEQACARVPEGSTFGNNPARTILGIGQALLAGELEYRQGNLEAGFAHLRDAVARDEALRYDEPWGWFQPAAHALGALLLEQGRLGEAEAVYRRDLALHPDNGWSLHGLEECLRRSGRSDEARAVATRFQQRWKEADVTIHASCFCRTAESQGTKSSSGSSPARATVLALVALSAVHASRR